jgi:hypothetical protein
MARYELKINADRVNGDNIGFRFELKHDMDVEWGIETRSFVQPDLSVSTMRLRSLTISPTGLVLHTKLHSV